MANLYEFFEEEWVFLYILRFVRNYLKVMTLEAQTIARACGKNHLHNLEPEDLVALTMEAAAMAQVPLAGTDWWPCKSGSF